MSYSNPKERRDDDRYEEPSSTIMLRGIPATMGHRDIRDALDDNHVNYIDVRVIKDKNTGKDPIACLKWLFYKYCCLSLKDCLCSSTVSHHS
ncbi:hypothetical protein PHET_11886 [Paragonimus heterotremus]|uniref:Uncharacterized protein n=1 Tax=Paragonimus heterotremus TaxID=100268 RepID=A0A8J4T3E0_9TREM|nr:hypothetical protein PHET_11886 [Paragonimus heterotremus]